MLFSLEQQIPNELCPHNEKQSPTRSWCLTWFVILPWDEERKGFATEGTYVWFLGWNVGHRLCLLLWPSRGSSGHFFLHIFVCVNYQGMNFMHTVFSWSFPTIESSKPHIPISLSQKAILGIPCIFYALSKFEAKKGKVVPVHGMMACRGRRVVTPLILNSGTKWCQVVNFMPQLLHPKKRTPVPIEYEAGWTREPGWMFWRREKFSYIISGFKAWIGQPVAQSLYQVCYLGSFWSKIWHKCVVPSDRPVKNQRSHLPCTTVNIEKEVQRAVSTKCSKRTQKIATQWRLVAGSCSAHHCCSWWWDWGL